MDGWVSRKMDGWIRGVSGGIKKVMLVGTNSRVGIEVECQEGLDSTSSSLSKKPEPVLNFKIRFISPNWGAFRGERP